LRGRRAHPAHHPAQGRQGHEPPRNAGQREPSRDGGGELMWLALLEAIGLGAAFALVLAILVAIVFLLVALVNMGWVALLQWRDIFSLDRWTEVMVTIGRSKLRTALTLVSVAWGIFVLVFLLGLGRGLNNGARHQFARDATNSLMFFANK